MCANAEDPTILSGTLRSTLDVFEEYEDAEIVSFLSEVRITPNSVNSTKPFVVYT